MLPEIQDKWSFPEIFRYNGIIADFKTVAYLQLPRKETNHRIFTLQDNDVDHRAAGSGQGGDNRVLSEERVLI